MPGRWESRKSFVLSGCLGYDKPLGRTGGYRLMIGDAYAYDKSIPQTIEHAPTENSLINDYRGVTFLYAETRQKAMGLNMAEMDLQEGDNVLLFKLIGKNKKSTDPGLNLINIVRERDE